MLNNIMISIITFAFVAMSARRYASNKILYAALGDSLAVGVLTIPQYGYAHYYRDYLAREKYSRGVSLNNLGKLGLTSSELLHAVQNDKTFQRVIKSADIITLDIGGNDLLDCNFDSQGLILALDTFKNNFSLILSQIRQLNSTALLLIVDIYNPYPKEHPLYQISQTWIPQFNQVINVTQANPLYKISGTAQAYNAFQGNEKKYTWIDEMNNVHPNAAGHMRIKDELIKVTP